MDDNVINAKLKLISKLKRETANSNHIINIKTNGSYSCTFVLTGTTLTNVSFSNLLDSIISYITDNRQYCPMGEQVKRGYISRVKSYKLKAKRINGKKEN